MFEGPATKRTPPRLCGMVRRDSVALHKRSKGVSVLPAVSGGFGFGVDVVVGAVRTLPLELKGVKTVKQQHEVDGPKIKLSIEGFLNAGSDLVFFHFCYDFGREGLKLLNALNFEKQNAGLSNFESVLPHLYPLV